MSLVVVTRPSTPLLTAAEVRTQLGMGPEIPDAKLDALVAAATTVLDGPEGWLGRALRPWTLEDQSNRFPRVCDTPTLACPPIRAIAFITYVDSLGVTRTLDPAAYEYGAESPALLYPATGRDWPAVREGRGAVRIRYECGYPDGEAPAPIRQAIVLQVAALNAMMRADPALTADTVVGVSSQSWAQADIGDIYDKAAARLLGPYRVFA